MIITPFYKGQGLGNQLANYVTLRAIAIDKGYSFGVMYPENFKGKGFINLDIGLPVIGGVIPVEGQTPSVLPEGIERYYREYINFYTDGAVMGDYDPKIGLLEDNTMVHGLLQGENYYKHRKEEINQWLSVEPLEMSDDLCVINFRGGEYKYVADFFLPQSYWNKAIGMMKEINPDMRFEVHTDDPETARQFFPNFHIIKDIGLNWRSVRFAKYLILSNSSFGFLPAWLGDAKKILAPMYWERHNKGRWQMVQNKTDKFTYICG